MLVKRTARLGVLRGSKSNFLNSSFFLFKKILVFFVMVKKSRFIVVSRAWVEAEVRKRKREQKKQDSRDSEFYDEYAREQGWFDGRIGALEALLAPSHAGVVPGARVSV